MFEGRGIGAIVVQDYHNPVAYTDEDKRLLLFVADQTAAAVHRQQVENAQREARTYFEKSFHSSPALMVINRVSDRVITEANPALLRAVGFTREEVIGRTPEEIKLWVNPSQREAFLLAIRERGAVRDLEADFRGRGGEQGSLLINADVLELGGTPSVLSVGIDISDRRRRERVQTATYAISQAVLAGGELPDAFSPNSTASSAASCRRKTLRRPPQPRPRAALLPLLRGRIFCTARTAPPGAGLTEYVINTARPLRTTADELTVIFRDDQRYKPTGKPAALWLGAPLMSDGRAIGVITVQDYHNAHAYSDSDLQLLMFVADQTAAAVHRQQVEAAQRESRLYFEKSFHSSPALMSLSRVSDRKMLEVNPAFTRSCGYTRDEVIGRTTRRYRSLG